MSWSGAAPRVRRAQVPARSFHGWFGARPLGRATSVAAVLLAGGLVTGRADIVALALPFLVAVTLGARPRPARLSTTLDLPVHVLPEGLALTASVRVAADADLDAAVVELLTPAGVSVVDGPAVRVVALRGGQELALDVRVRALQWGRRAVGPVRVTAAGAYLLLRTPAGTAPAQELRVLPAAEAFDAEGAMPQALAHAGTHLSRRHGDGAEFAGVRPYAPGDRPRRVNWRVSLRAGGLHVTNTMTERSADLVVLLDSLHDAGVSGGVGGRASSLDVTVRAAAGIAEHYLTRGDSVGLVDYGGRLRFLPPAAGRAQLRRVQEFLLDTAVDTAGGQLETRLLGPRVLPARALVIALTPLLDPRASHLLAELRGRGQAVVAVDTLPDDALPPARKPAGALAQRLWRLEREELLARLGEIGVPVVPWSGSGSLDAVLHDVARMAAGPRVVLR